MTEPEWRLFLDSAMLICALMAIINGLRYKSRGASAYLLGAAFLAMGGTVYLLREKAGQTQLILGGALVFLLLVADLVVRNTKQEAKRREKS